MAFILVSVTVLAGCTAGPDDHLDDDSDSAAGSDRSTTPLHLTLTGCEAWESGYSWVGGNGPGTAPPSWDVPPVAPAQTISLAFISCDRISWGNLTRGPTTFLIESYTKGNPPDQCQGTSVDDASLLIHRLWFEDGELADYVNATLRIPTTTMDFSVAETHTDAVSHYVVEWSESAGDQGPSSVEFTDVWATYEPRRYAQRIFWDHGLGIGVLHLVADSMLQDFNVQPAWGTLSDETMNGAAGRPEWVGSNRVRHDIKYDSRIEVWGDYECEQPAF